MKNGKVRKSWSKRKREPEGKKGLQRDEDDQSDLSLRTRESDQKERKQNRIIKDRQKCPANVKLTTGRSRGR
jgi:hypothetical protein